MAKSYISKFWVLLVLGVCLLGTSAVEAAPIQAAREELIRNVFLSDADVSVDFRVPSYQGPAGSLRRVKVVALYAVRNRIPYQCDDPENGIKGICDNNGVGFSATIDIFGNTQTSMEFLFGECHAVHCMGTFGYQQGRVEYEVFDDEAEDIFLGTDPIIIEDIVKFDVNYDPLCISGECLLEPLGTRGFVFTALTYFFDPKDPGDPTIPRATLVSEPEYILPGSLCALLLARFVRNRAARTRVSRRKA